MKYPSLIVCALVATSPVMAGRPGHDDENGGRATRSLITVTTTGLACTTTAGSGAFNARSWTWGASNSGTGSGSGGGVGKASFQDLAITKAFDGCSPTLLGAVSTGRHLPTLTLSQTDSNGDLVARVELDEVIISSWSVGGNVRDSMPEETVTFNFRRVRVSSEGSTFCFDLALGRAC